MTGESGESNDAVPGWEQCASMRRRCFSLNLRRTERVVTRHYDAHLAAAGLTAVQFPILAIIASLPEPTFRQLSAELDLDRSTLSRNLALLEQMKLVKVGPSSGPKPGPLSLTRKGRNTLVKAYDCWLAAHEALTDLLSSTAAEEGIEFLKTLRRGARTAQAHSLTEGSSADDTDARRSSSRSA